MADVNTEIIIRAKDEASAVLNQFSDTATSVGGSIKDTLAANVVQLGSVFAATSGVIVSSISAFTESQDVAAQLDAVLKSTNATAGVTREQVLALGASLQQQSKFSDESIVSAQNLLLTFTNISGTVFPNATKTTLDMAQALGMDLTSATRIVGKALNDPIEGLSALSRVGVQFTEEQKEQIKVMVESGDVMGAQQLVLDSLSSKFGGSALAASQTFTGQMAILNNTANDVQETIGQALLESIISALGGVEGITAAVKSFNEFLIQHKEVLLGVTFALIGIATVMGGLFLAAIIAVTGASAALVAGLTVLVAGIGFAAGVIIAKWGDIKGFILGVIDSITKRWDDFVKGFSNVFNNISDKLASLKDKLNLSFSSDAFKGLPGFATGGIVPGPIGAPQLVMAHGGEQITPFRGNTTNNTSTSFNVQIGMYAGSPIEKRNIAENLYKELVVLAKSKNKSVSELLGA